MLVRLGHPGCPKPYVSTVYFPSAVRLASASSDRIGARQIIQGHATWQRSTETLETVPRPMLDLVWSVTLRACLRDSTGGFSTASCPEILSATTRWRLNNWPVRRRKHSRSGHRSGLAGFGTKRRVQSPQRSPLAHSADFHHSVSGSELWQRS